MTTAENNPCACILTAGKGSRLNERTKYFNKALLRVGDQAVISHTINAFPDNTRFVIALGYKGSIVRQYLRLAHPEKKFTFISVDKYSEPGAGPGYALKACREHLQRPFYYVSCDSIIDWHFKIWRNDVRGWAGISVIPMKERKKYCTVSVLRDPTRIAKVHDKDPNGTTWAFNGVAYIPNYFEFWGRMDKAAPTVDEEIQVAPHILSLSQIKPIAMKWYDTGSEEGLREARKNFEGIENLDKLDEELYVVNDNVVKYFHNANMVKHRIQRTEHLDGMAPLLIGSSTNFYKYAFVPGKDLFKLERPQDIMLPLLEETQTRLWSKGVTLTEVERNVFDDVCRKFYYDKTLSRLYKVYEKLSIEEGADVINDRLVPSLTNFLKGAVNWDRLSHGFPAKFHGDYNFSNIVWSEKEKSFTLLDWRQNFGGSIEYGDIYYDFAKMYHGFLFPHPSVKKGAYFIKEKGERNFRTFIEVPCEIALCKDIFEDFIVDNGYDIFKVRLLACLVLLNMSPLHESPMDKYLYYYGKRKLWDIVKS